MCWTFLSHRWLKPFCSCWQPFLLARIQEFPRIEGAMASASSAAPAPLQGLETEQEMLWCTARNAMRCPSCAKWKSKCAWSPAQWKGWSPYHEQTFRNCCNDFSLTIINGLDHASPAAAESAHGSPAHGSSQSSEHAPPAAAESAHGSPAHGSSHSSEHGSQAAADPPKARCMRPSASIVMPSRQEAQTIFDDTIMMLRILTLPDFLDTYAWMMTEITQKSGVSRR